jgi:hypothetical protein
VVDDPVMMMLVPPALADGEPLQRVCLPGASASDGLAALGDPLDQPTAGFAEAATGRRGSGP